MKEIDSCLRQVSKVRAVARQEKVAYVARSRLGRLVLALVRLASTISDIPFTDRPVRPSVPKDTPADVRSLVEICNRIIDTTSTLVQPSEPLDERWKSGWSDLMTDLDRIERQLQVIKARFGP